MATLDTASPFLERRGHARREVDFRAFVRLPDGQALPCRVIDVSPMGARLSLREPHPLPQTFKLTIPDELFSAECECRHQSGMAAGVLFTSGRMEALARFG